MSLHRYLVVTLLSVVLFNTPRPARSLEGVTSVERLLRTGPADDIRALIKAVQDWHETSGNIVFLFRLLSYDQFNFSAYWEVGDAEELPTYYATIRSLATPDSLSLALRYLIPLGSLLGSSEGRSFLLDHLLDPTIDYPLGLTSLSLTHFTAAERIRILRHINEHQRHSLQSVHFLFDLLDESSDKGVTYLAKHNLWQLVDGAFFPSFLCSPNMRIIQFVKILARAAKDVTNDLAYYRLLVLRHMALSASLKLTIDRFRATIPTNSFRTILNAFFDLGRGASELLDLFLRIKALLIVPGRLRSTFVLEHLTLGQRKKLPAPFMLPLILKSIITWSPSQMPPYAFRDLLTTLPMEQIHRKLLPKLSEPWIRSYLGDFPCLGHWIMSTLPLSVQLRRWRATILCMLSKSGIQRYQRTASLPGVGTFYTNLVRPNGRLFLDELIEWSRQVFRQEEIQLPLAIPDDPGKSQLRSIGTSASLHLGHYSVDERSADGTTLTLPRQSTPSIGERRRRPRERTGAKAGRIGEGAREHHNSGSDNNNSSSSHDSVRLLFGDWPPQLLSRKDMLSLTPHSSISPSSALLLAVRGKDGTVRFNCDLCGSSRLIQHILRLWQGWIADLALHGQPLPCVSSTLQGVLLAFITPKTLDARGICIDEADDNERRSRLALHLVKALRQQLFNLSVPSAVFGPGAPCTMPGSQVISSYAAL